MHQMTSDAKIAANRRNAKRSTGPRTQDGKTRSSTNALKHGLLAEGVLVSGESREEFTALSDQIYHDLEPQGAIETALVDRILGGLWRLRRLQQVEAGLFENEISRAAREREDESLPRDERALRDAINPRSAPSEAERQEAVRRATAAEWGAAFLRDAAHADAFSKLSRYDRSLEGTVLRALHELQRLQAVRTGERRSPAAFADLDVSARRGPQMALPTGD